MTTRRKENLYSIQYQHTYQDFTIQKAATAWALLKYETLDEKQILSLFNTGKMPEKSGDSEFPSEKAATFEESKEALERKEALKKQALADKDTKDTAELYPSEKAAEDDSLKTTVYYPKSKTSESDSEDKQK